MRSSLLRPFRPPVVERLTRHARSRTTPFPSANSGFSSQCGAISRFPGFRATCGGAGEKGALPPAPGDRIFKKALGPGDRNAAVQWTDDRLDPPGLPQARSCPRRPVGWKRREAERLRQNRTLGLLLQDRVYENIYRTTATLSRNCRSFWRRENGRRFPLGLGRRAAPCSSRPTAAGSELKEPIPFTMI